MVESRLIGSRPIARGTVEYAFERPSAFDWRAGHFAYFVLPAAGDVQSDRPFTLAGVPGDGVITLATRLGTSPFKQALGALRPGDQVLIDGPMGGFTLGPEDRDVVWLAGGMGVTPFRSMVREIAAAKVLPSVHATLFYSTPTVAEAAYLDEFQQAACRGWLTLVVTVTREEAPPDPMFEFGRIDGSMICRHLSSLDSHSWFIAGDTEMVLDLERVLAREGVPRECIRVDPFLR